MNAGEIDEFRGGPEYLRCKIEGNSQFEPHRQELLEIILTFNHDELEAWAYKVKRQGLDKENIYRILLELWSYLDTILKLVVMHP